MASSFHERKGPTSTGLRRVIHGSKVKTQCVIVASTTKALSRKLRHCADIFRGCSVTFERFFRVAGTRSIYRGRKLKENRRPGDGVQQAAHDYWHESASQKSRCSTRAPS